MSTSESTSSCRFLRASRGDLESLLAVEDHAQVRAQEVALIGMCSSLAACAWRTPLSHALVHPPSDSKRDTKVEERLALRPRSDCILICRVCKASTARRYLRHRASDGLEVRVTPEGTV